MTPGLEARGLGKRYGKVWGLRDCSISIPLGRVVGLVGANGAGKTTLLHLAVGLLRPSAGGIQVLGATPGEDPDLMARVGFVAQDSPLYDNLTVADHLKFGRSLNPVWDREAAESRLSARYRSRPPLRPPVRRSAGPGGAGPRHRQATGSAAARRAAGELGPPRKESVPAESDGGGRGAGARHRGVVAPPGRHGAGLRLPGPPLRRRGAPLR